MHQFFQMVQTVRQDQVRVVTLGLTYNIISNHSVTIPMRNQVLDELLIIGRTVRIHIKFGPFHSCKTRQDGYLHNTV